MAYVCVSIFIIPQKMVPFEREIAMPHAQSIFSFFWHHIKPYKYYYAIMLFAPIFSSFYHFVYNYAIKLIIDVMAEQQTFSWDAVIYPVALYVSIQILLEVFWRISSVAEWLSEPYVRRSILLESYDYLQHHPYIFFQNHLAGTLSSKIKGIWDGYDKFWGEMHHGIFLKILQVIVGLAALCVVNYQLAVFVFLWCLVYTPLMFVMSRKIGDLSEIETESRYRIIGRVADNVSNIFSLFSFATHRFEKNALHKEMTEDFIPKQLNTYKSYFKMMIVAGVLYVLLLVSVLFYMIYLRTINVVTLGDFAFVFSMLVLVTNDLWNLTESLQDFSRVMGDAKSSLSILQIPHQSPDEEQAQSLTMVNPTIEMNHVSFSHVEKSSLFSDLNISIRAGEKVGLVGPSGAGKSSLIHLLLRYFSPHSGDILVSGQNIRHVTQDSLRQQIAVIPQDTMLFHRTLMENIRYGRPDATDDEVIEAAKKAHIHEYIATLPNQYGEFVGERGVKLSGGQRQRIAIARAILKNAPILILDEATSALDSQTEKLIQDSLSLLIEDKRKTVIAIAHRLFTLQHMDRIIVLDQGKICEEGTHAELINNPASLYRQLWKQQSQHHKMEEES